MVLTSCQFIIITEQNRFCFLTLKNFKRIECQRKKNKKIFKSVFQKKTSIFNFYTTWIFDTHTTGYYNFKKKTPCNIPFEVKYTSNVATFCREKYLIGKYDLKCTCFLFFSIKHMFMNKLYKTKSFEKKLFPCNIYNWYFNQNIVQNLNEYIGFIYIFKFFDSKLSTVCIDGIFSMKKYHTNSFYLYKNLISTEHKTSCLILHIQFLEPLNLYVKLSKNFRTNYNFNYFFKFNLNITLSRALVYCFFFISFFFVRIFKFALSHEIIFYSKKKFNLIKFLLDKNFQIDKQQKNVYFTNFVSFFSIKINRMCLNQLRSTYVKCKKSVYTYVYGYNSTLVFQKKFIERIAEKIWNLKLKFSESLFENFSKKFKKRSEIFSKKKQHNFFKYIKLVILLYIKINVLYKNSFLRKFRLMLFYSTYSFYFCVKLYFNFISWANTNVDLNEFKLFFSKKKTTGHRNCTKVLYQNLILKKYFKYEH